MAAYSGKEGSVLVDASLEINELREWALDIERNSHIYFSRHGGGWQETIDGCDHGSGRIVLNFDATNPPASCMPNGRLVSLQLKCANSGEMCSGSARIKKHSYNPKLSGEEQQVTVEFDTHGAWTIPTT